MGKDRQETKLRKEGRVQSDRDQSLEYKGAATLEGPESAKVRNGLKK
ncbi:YpzI family protein [Pseudalkalibacillus caeni]|uniref:YpzI family protein n=1 Tax=Exobacillus caeni TaxID=2574798 RepID=A0A5R9EXU2_9BACL|nr:YpzI family protein [Pseudalkalibacillus caeni]TLS35937.1 YpzI family protein [Pseudalkalibacillus caeni]